MNALVVPTNSVDRTVAFLTAWSPWPWDYVIVVQDGPAADLALPDPLRDEATDRLAVYSWADIDALAPDGVFSRQDSAIRSFGFWRAWLDGAEIVFTLDDDCYPTDEDFVATHRDNLFRTAVWTSSVPGMHVRGMPYRNLGGLTNVQVSVGLWRGIPDIDAVHTLTEADLPATSGVPTRVMPGQQFFPMSGMNLAFRREVACLMYFPPMGLNQPYARFDDIWCGLLLQRISRHLGYSIVCGRPLVDHRRASDPFVNLVKEAPGIRFNETLWEEVDSLPLSASEPRECMLEAGTWLGASSDPYVAGWGSAITSWCGLFDARPSHTLSPSSARTP